MTLIALSPSSHTVIYLFCIQGRENHAHGKPGTVEPRIISEFRDIGPPPDGCNCCTLMRVNFGTHAPGFANGKSLQLECAIHLIPLSDEYTVRRPHCRRVAELSLLRDFPTWLGNLRHHFTRDEISVD